MLITARANGSKKISPVYKDRDTRDVPFPEVRQVCVPISITRRTSNILKFPVNELSPMSRLLWSRGAYASATLICRDATV